jgi:hypothetical protein
MQAKPIRLMRCEDLGPGTHLLNGLRLEEDPWTFLVVVDDDHIYGGHGMGTLILCWRKVVIGSS